MTDGSQQVLQVLRPDAKTRAEYGADLIRKTLVSLAERHPALIGSEEIIDHSVREWREELDPSLTLEKIQSFHDLFQGKVISGPNGNVPLFAPSVFILNDGTPAVGDEYRILSKIAGEPFTKAALETSPKHMQEAANLTAQYISFFEMASRFSGRKKDKDWHGGNVLVDTLGNSIQSIGRVDTGGMAFKNP